MVRAALLCRGCSLRGAGFLALLGPQTEARRSRPQHSRRPLSCAALLAFRRLQQQAAGPSAALLPQWLRHTRRRARHRKAGQARQQRQRVWGETPLLSRAGGGLRKPVAPVAAICVLAAARPPVPSGAVLAHRRTRLPPRRSWQTQQRRQAWQRPQRVAGEFLVSCLFWESLRRTVAFVAGAAGPPVCWRF